jgi:hypothetical protein
VVSCSYCLLFGGPESYLIQQSSFRGEHYTYVSPHPLEENEEKAWIDVNALAVRQGREKDEIPDYPIRICFKRVKHPIYVDYVVESVKELTKEEAATSKALSRQPDEKKKFGPWLKKK